MKICQIREYSVSKKKKWEVVSSGITNLLLIALNIYPFNYLVDATILVVALLEVGPEFAVN